MVIHFFFRVQSSKTIFSDTLLHTSDLETSFLQDWIIFYELIGFIQISSVLIEAVIMIFQCREILTMTLHTLFKTGCFEADSKLEVKKFYFYALQLTYSDLKEDDIPTFDDKVLQFFIFTNLSFLFVSLHHHQWWLWHFYHFSLLYSNNTNTFLKENYIQRINYIPRYHLVCIRQNKKAQTTITTIL